MKPKDVIKFKDPANELEAAERYVVVEDRGPRVLVEPLHSNMTIIHQPVFLKEEMEVVELIPPVITGLPWPPRTLPTSRSFTYNDQHIIVRAETWKFAFGTDWISIKKTLESDTVHNEFKKMLKATVEEVKNASH